MTPESTTGKEYEWEKLGSHRGPIPESWAELGGETKAETITEEGERITGDREWFYAVEICVQEWMYVEEDGPVESAGEECRLYVRYSNTAGDRAIELRHEAVQTGEDPKAFKPLDAANGYPEQFPVRVLTDPETQLVDEAPSKEGDAEAVADLYDVEVEESP